MREVRASAESIVAIEIIDTDTAAHFSLQCCSSPPNHGRRARARAIRLQVEIGKIWFSGRVVGLYLNI